MLIFVTDVLSYEQELEYKATVRSESLQQHNVAKNPSLNADHLTKRELLRINSDRVYLTAPVSSHVIPQGRHPLTRV
ncbi:hypothetical protein C6P44_001488 [Monosporozyma unispora]|nr:hypothetical protein C6P44_001488 [Kazachstania unispora]